MSPAQKLGVGLLYAAIAVSGAAYAVLENHEVDRLAHFFKETVPALLVLILVLVVYGFVRRALSIFKELSGASQAAHAALHVDYGKMRFDNSDEPSVRTLEKLPRRALLRP
jgi:hypothetical protein